jgi:hypothetical protein
MSAVVGGGRVKFDYPTRRKEREGWGTGDAGDRVQKRCIPAQRYAAMANLLVSSGEL